jgi:hypothetical protein
VDLQAHLIAQLHRERDFEAAIRVNHGLIWVLRGVKGSCANGGPRWLGATRRSPKSNKSF